MVAFSKIVNYNLTPVFEFWGLPLTDNAKDSVTDLPAYFPEDFITQKYGPEQATAILEKYPDAVRNPDPLPSIEVTVVDVLSTACEIPLLDLDEPDDESGNDSECEGSRTERDEL